MTNLFGTNLNSRSAAGPGRGEGRESPSSLPRYAEYKDSGVAWLGEVPVHWQIKRLKFGLRLLTEKTTKRTNPVALENIESWSGRFLATETEFQGEGVAFEDGDILFGKLRPYLAKVLLAKSPGEAVGDFHVLHPDRGVVPRFAQYQLLSREFVAVVDGSTFGSKMPRASWDFLANMPLLIPNVAEQSAIAAFLDRETGKLDALIAEQEKLLTLLAKKRQATISHAVTRGLNPNAPMKDSGVPWLGEVPAHWDVGKIQSFAKRESGHTPSRQHPEYWEDCTIPWFSLADVWQIRSGDVKYVHETKESVSELGLANSSARLLPKGTVILSRTASVGYSAIMGCDMATTQDFVNWICKPDLLPEFLLYVLRGMQPEFDRLMMGSTHQTIYMPDIAKLMMTQPPIEEQVEIISFLEVVVGKLDNLKNEAESGIALLKERRSALIAAAVTGKIDVRQAA
jgi:type I restriction enzyme, S subunit